MVIRLWFGHVAIFGVNYVKKKRVLKVAGCRGFGGNYTGKRGGTLSLGNAEPGGSTVGFDANNHSIFI